MPPLISSFVLLASLFIHSMAFSFLRFSSHPPLQFQIEPSLTFLPSFKHLVNGVPERGRVSGNRLPISSPKTNARWNEDLISMFLHSQRPTPLTSLPSSSVFHSSGAPTTYTTRWLRFNLRLSVRPLAGSRLSSNSTFVVHQAAPLFLPSPSKLPSSSTLTSKPRFCKNDAAETIKAIEENTEKYIKILLKFCGQCIHGKGMLA